MAYHGLPMPDDEDRRREDRLDAAAAGRPPPAGVDPDKVADDVAELIRPPMTIEPPPPGQYAPRSP